MLYIDSLYTCCYILITSALAQLEIMGCVVSGTQSFIFQHELYDANMKTCTFHNFENILCYDFKKNKI